MASHQLDTLPDRANVSAETPLMVSWQAVRGAEVLRNTRIFISRAEDIELATQAALRRTHHLELAAQEIERAVRVAAMVQP